MDLSDLDYELPPSRIAQVPTERREDARLLVIDRSAGQLADCGFAELPGLLRSGDCLVVNDSRVIPARVFAWTRSGGPVELLFLEPEAGGRWWALAGPGRRARPGAALITGGETPIKLRVVRVDAEGTRLVEPLDDSIEGLLHAHGAVPLPPYIARHAKPGAEDAQRYQTVYSEHPGSVAAATAGLHFTEALLGALRARGIEIHALTLHVGLATFRPIRTANLAAHSVPHERVAIPADVAAAVNAARADGRRVVAVGTTTTRALEGAADGGGRVEPRTGTVDLTIRPGHRFRVVDALLTNFHLPRSSLLLLVMAFAGRDLILKSYRHAVAAGYRFYSYGDATLIE